jgi:hypothetical protein
MPYVRGHIRAGGWVRPHWRRPPGGGPGVAGTLLLVAIVVAILAGAGGALPSRPSPPSTRPPVRNSPEPRQPQYIVQVASMTRRAQAAQAAAALRARGYGKAGVLRSDHYQGLRPGYWVTYIGPYPPTEPGRAQARNVQQRLGSALVRLVAHRGTASSTSSSALPRR